MENKSKLLELLAKDQKRLKDMLAKCPTVVGTPDEDLLQDFYIFVFSKNYRLLSVEHMFPEGDMHEGLVFTILKNFVYGEIRKNVANNTRKNEAYSAWKYDRLNESDSNAINLASESNMIILNEIKKDLTDKEYEGLIDIVEKRLIFKFKDKDGNTDKVAYQAAIYKLNKKYKEIKEKSHIFDYMTPEQVDSFELTLKFNK